MIIHINGVDREATENEIAEIKESQLEMKREAKARQAEATARVDARTSALAKLAKLGLTQAEIEAL